MASKSDEMTFSKSSSSRLQVIWLDDEKGDMTLNPTEYALKRNFDLKVVRSPDDLLKILAGPATKADVLLLDVIFKTPPKDARLKGKPLPTLGLAVLELLRSGELGERWRVLPVVGLTASADPASIRKIEEIQGKDHLTKFVGKPIVPSKVVQEVREAGAAV